jgi:integrase
VRLDDGTTVKQRSARYGKGSRWRARYVDDAGNEHSKQFAIKADAQSWLDEETAAIVAGKHVPPRHRKVTVQEWCELWLDGYKSHRPKTVEGARTHVQLINGEFGDLLLTDLRPSAIKNWTARLSDDYAPATIARCHSRFRQILEDAVHDNLLGSNPCSRRTSPPAAKPKLYVLSTEQVWALHDVMPDRLKVAVLLGAFAGLRVSEACGLRVSDIDFLRCVIHPKVQYRDRPLKTAACDAPIPIPRDLKDMIAASVARYPSTHVVTSGKTGRCNPCAVQLAVAAAREKVPGLPETVTFHDLRHHLASMLFASGVDVVRVQHRMRHATAATTLRLYAHLMADADEATNDAVSAAMKLRNASGLN